MLRNFKYKVNRNIILFVFGYLMAVQAAKIVMNGSVWDNTILTYLFAVLFFFLHLSVYNRKMEKVHVLLALVLDIFLISVFIAGILNNKIQGDIIVSKLLVKCLLVSIGGFFLCHTIAYVWLYKVKNIITKSGYILILAVMAGTVLSFHIQGLVTLFSAFGYLFAIVLFECMLLKSGGIKLENKILWTFAFVFALMSTLGNMDKIAQYIDVKQFDFPMVLCMITAVAFWCLIWKYILQLCMEGMKYIENNLNAKEEPFSLLKKSILVFLFIFICWLPYFLTYYPGFLSSDSITQLEQAIGRQSPTNHHPWIHTMLIKACYLIGNNLGDSIEYGVLLYSLVSMTVLSIVYTYIWRWMVRNGVRWKYRMAAILFYAIFPINAVYAITMWKDIFFSAVILLYVLTLYEGCRPDRPDLSTKFMVKFIILSFLVCAFRSNGIFAWAFSAVFLIYTFWHERKRLAIMILSVMGLFLLYKGSLHVVGIQDADFIESLSIPAQQIAYVVKEDGNVSEAEYEMLEKIIDVEKIEDVYVPYISDPIKHLVRMEGEQQYLEEHKLEYLQLYVSIGLKNPHEFVQAYVNQTKGYWFHKVNNWIYYKEGVHENDLGIEGKPLLPAFLSRAVYKITELSEQLYHRYFSLALQTYLFMLCTAFSVIKKKNITAYMPLAGVIFSLLIATPVCAEFRYVYPLFVAIPVLPIMALNKVS